MGYTLKGVVEHGISKDFTCPLIEGKMALMQSEKAELSLESPLYKRGL